MGSYNTYLTRIIPALSVVGVVLLLFVSLVVAPYGKIERGEHHGRSTKSQLLLSIYTILLHIPPVIFPARLCWAIGHVMKKMKETAGMVHKAPRRPTQRGKKGQTTLAYPTPLYVVIIPAYKEEVGTLEETLRVLASHSQARNSYHIYLAMEGKEENSDSKAISLIQSFKKSFFRMSFTVHPFGIPGEAQGKSSNESWAAKQAFTDYPDEIKRNVIMTVMDADTHLSERYFAQIDRYHAQYPESSEETIYVPPLVFDRNVHQVPLPVRTSDLVWAGAGMSNLYNGSKICIPTSVYSLSMALAENVGGWDTGPEAIGEDMHMYLKCFFALSGNLTVRVVYAAASQCNVSSNLDGVKGYWDGLGARYKQALRHMWGAMDTGYAIRQTLTMIRKRYRVLYSARSSSPGMLELARTLKDSFMAAMSTVCGSNWTALEKRSGKPGFSVGKSIDAGASYSKPIHVWNMCLLYNSLFEAHFLPVHLALILSTTTIYGWIAGSLVPYELSMALTFSEMSRWVGWSLVCLYFYRYEKYHRLCLELREAEMRKAGLLEGADHDRNGFSRKLYGRLGFLEGCLFPIGGFLFGSIPACQAVLSHVFTDRLTYQVSLKPQFVQGWRLQNQTPTQSKPLRSKMLPPKSSHMRCPSDTWRKQAIAHLDHFTTALAFNQPVKQKD